MSAINSPFRYAGGKFYARKLILAHIPPHHCYMEPFAGGASIFFAKEKATKNTLNDIDSELMNCYWHIQNRVEDLIALLDGQEATKEKHYYFKNVFRPGNDLERAFRWFYLNRTSYSGIMNPVNCYWGYGPQYSMPPHNWPNHLRRCSQKIQNVQLLSVDFAQVVENAPDNAFLFIDPPYFEADQAKFYTHSFSLDDHYRLEMALYQHRHRLNFLLTYDNNPKIDQLYHWATHRLQQQWNYTINRTDDQTKDARLNGEQKGKRYMGRELFILNYDGPVYGSGVADSPHQLTLFEGQPLATNGHRPPNLRQPGWNCQFFIT